MVQIENQMAYIKDEGKMLAYLTFIKVRDNVVNINHTYTHPSKRGKGLAKLIMDNLYEHLKDRKYKAIASCSYAVSYFKKYPEKQDILL